MMISTLAERREQPGAGGVGRVGRQAVELLAHHRGRTLHLARGGERLAGADRDLGDVDVGLGAAAGVGEQLEGLLEVVGGLVGTTDVARLLARAHAGGQGGVEVVGQPGVAGELGRRAGGPAVAQRRDVRRVEPDPLAGQEVVVDRLAEQGVAEAVVALVRDEDVALDGAAHAVLEAGLGETGDLVEQLVGDAAPGHAGRAHDLAGVVVELVEADEQHVGELLGHPAAGAGGGADELLDEEGVALGAVDDAGDLALGQRLGVELVDQAPDVGRRQRLELEALDALEPGPLRDLGAEGVPSVQVVGAVRRDDGDRPEEGPGEQEGEEVAGRPVGPVGVLDDDEERRLLGSGVEERVHRLEEVGPLERGAVDAPGVGGQAAALRGGGEDPASGLEAGQGGVAAGDGVDDVGQLGGEAAEHLGEGEVGQRAVAEVEAVAGDDLPAVRDGDVAQLGEQPGLPDAGVSGEQHCRAGGAGGVGRDTEERGELAELGVTPDEGPAGGGGHDVHHVVDRRHGAHCFVDRCVRGRGGRGGGQRLEVGVSRRTRLRRRRALAWRRATPARMRSWR